MKTIRSELSLLFDLLTAPRAAFAALAASAPVGAVLLVLGGLQAGMLVAQSFALQPALLADPLLADASGDAATALHRFWGARSLAVLLGPAAMGLRGVALATLLQGIGALLGLMLPWRTLLALALHVEVVFWLESLCVTVLVALAHPTTLEQLASLRLHAGIDLVWVPSSTRIAALLEAANLFSVWWAVLLALGLVWTLRVRPRMACGLAATMWSGLVALRFVMSGR